MDGTQDYHTKLVKERQISYAITHMRNLVLKGYKWTYLQAETDLQILKINLRGGCQRGNVKGRDKSGVWNKHAHATIYKIDNQQRYTV